MRRTTTLSMLTLLLCACAAETEPAKSAAEGTRLEAICVNDDAAVPVGEFRCDEPHVVECEKGMAWEDRLHVARESCLDVAPRVSETGPFALGSHTIGVDGAGGQLCEAELTVVDTQPPEIVTEYEPILWPNDDRLHAVSPSDCVEVEDACSPHAHAFFTSATSDEPTEVRGPMELPATDILAKDCRTILLRAYRDADGDGRVYELGWRAVDALGHMVEGTCRVSVPLYPGSEPAVDSGDAYRMELGCTR